MKDWDLTLLSLWQKQRDPPLDMLTKMPEYPYGLRRHRYFVNPSIYYVVIAMDLLLRCTWSLKLSPHLHHINEWEGGIFILELLEVFRRWVVSSDSDYSISLAFVNIKTVDILSCRDGMGAKPQRPSARRLAHGRISGQV